MHPAIYLPLLVATIVNATVSPDVGVIAISAPAPSLPAAMTLDYGAVVVTAPDPAPIGALEMPAAVVAVTAPDISSIGDGNFTIGVDFGTVIVTAPDPTLSLPSMLRLEPFVVVVTSPNPTVDYAFVSGELGNLYRHAPVTSSSSHQHRRQISQALTNTQQGKLNNTGTLTLLANVPLTPLRDPRLTPESIVTWDPMTAHATAELLVNGTMYVSEANRQAGQWLITHASNSQTDRTFRYSVTS